MLGFLIRRILWTIPVLWLVATVTFFLMHSAPGSPYLAQSGGRMVNPAMEASFNRRYGLDKPLFIQYTTYLGNAVRFDWGESFQQQGEPVTSVIARGFPYSAKVGLLGLLIAVAIGVPLGIIAALKQNTVVDYVSLFLATIGATVPSFVVGIFLLVLFAVRWPIFPVVWEEGWRPYVLPSLVLGFASAAFLARLTRSSILEIMRQDYVRTARAKGLPGRTVILRHILRNGLIPVVTIMGPALAGLITGSIIIERIFNIPGMGYLFIDSIYARDYPLILATTVFYTLFIVMGNLLVDITYGFVDPRIKTG
jgi:ABC-type dipeptide/oligopeptide/nickel transport system permease component